MRGEGSREQKRKQEGGSSTSSKSPPHLATRVLFTYSRWGWWYQQQQSSSQNLRHLYSSGHTRQALCCDCASHCVLPCSGSGCDGTHCWNCECHWHCCDYNWASTAVAAVGAAAVAVPHTHHAPTAVVASGEESEELKARVSNNPRVTSKKKARTIPSTWVAVRLGLEELWVHRDTWWIRLEHHSLL